jgi:hypothetical protein
MEIYIHVKNNVKVYYNGRGPARIELRFVMLGELCDHHNFKQELIFPERNLQFLSVRSIYSRQLVINSGSAIDGLDDENQCFVLQKAFPDYAYRNKVVL